MQSFKKINKNIIHGFIFILLLSALYSIIHFNFLLFHTLAEVFSIVIAFGIFIIAWNSKKYSDNNYFLFIGISYLFTGTIDLFHTLTYKGVNIIPEYDADLSTQLWIIGRYMESISFIVAPVFIKKKLNINIFFLIYTLITMLLLFSAFKKIFPACYIEGYGLTGFKIISEYLICIIIVLSAILLTINKKYFDRKILNMLIIALISKIISEISFTLYIDVYGLSNIIGHFFKIIAFYLFYLAIVQTGIEKPYQLIFRELKNNEEKLSAIALTDELTGLYNRRACYEYLRKIMALTRRDKNSLCICLIDLDYLKTVNDNYGHSQGDKLLKSFGDILKKYIRESDYICRIGGDEFLLIFSNCTQTDAKNYIHRVIEGIEIYNKNNKRFKIAFSYGLAEFNYRSKESTIDKIIEIADKNMYKDKSAKKRLVQKEKS